VKTYIYPRIFNLAAVVEKLASLSPDEPETAVATGTVGGAEWRDSGTHPKAGNGIYSASICKDHEQSRSAENTVKEGEKWQLAGIGTEEEKERAMGVEPTTNPENPRRIREFRTS